MPSDHVIRLPTELYAVGTLLDGWRADRPASYGDTYDGRTYLAATAAKLRAPTDPEVAYRRALHDHHVGAALYEAIEGREVVAFMGGHRLLRTDPAYETVAEIAWRLAQGGYLVVSGGGPGAMEAAHLGARLAVCGHDELTDALTMVRDGPDFPDFEPSAFAPGGRFEPELLARLHAWQEPAFRVADRWSGDAAGDSIGVPTWLYGHEPPTPLATRHAKYFENSLREDGLLAIAKAGVVFAKGGAGTLQEVFQDAAQNYYETVDGTSSPMVFLDIDEFWSVTRPVKLLLEGLFGEVKERLLHFVTTPGEAVAAITAGVAPR